MATRQDYLRELRRFLKRIYVPELSPIWEKQGRPEEWFSVGMMRHFLSYAFAVLWKFGRRARDLREAKRLLLEFEEAHPFSCWAAAGAYQILKSSLGNAERDGFAERWVGHAKGSIDHYCGSLDLRYAYGNNHKVMACLWADLARQVFPRHAEPYGYDAVTDQVWQLWWDRRDFQEQATGYEAFAEHAHCVWAKVRGVEKEFYTSPSILNMFERNMLIVAPSGLITAYGDSGHPVQPSHWPAIFERVARATRDGRFRQCADEIFQRCCRTGYWQKVGPVEGLSRMPQYLARSVYRNLAEDAMAMADAALHCDERVKPKPRPYAGLVRRLPVNEVLRQGEREGGRVKPERYNTQQVALVGGSGPKTYLLLSVGRALRHDHPDAGAIQLLAHGDTTLLGTNGYLCRELCYHNTFFAQEADRPCFPDDRPKKGLPGSSECHGTVESLESSADSSFCRVRFEGFHGLPADLVRDIVIDREGTVTLIDSLHVRQGTLRAGLLFHGERVREDGPHTYRLRLNTLKMVDGMMVEKEPGEVSVHFAFGEGQAETRRLEMAPIFDTLPVYQVFPCSGYKKLWKASYNARQCLAFSREVDRGEQARFVTVLRPIRG